MVDQLFPDPPEQREGPITVDGRTLVTCPDCYGEEFDRTSYGGGDEEDDPCLRCNGGGVVLVRTALHRGR